MLLLRICLLYHMSVICNHKWSVASLTYLVGQLLAKLNSQHPRPSSENSIAARQKFSRSNNELWLAIQKLELVSTNFNRPKPEPVLLSNTQSPSGISKIRFFLACYSKIKKERLLKILEDTLSKPKLDGFLATGKIYEYRKEICCKKSMIKLLKEKFSFSTDRSEDMFLLKSSHVNSSHSAVFLSISYYSALSKKNSSYNFNGSGESTSQKPVPDSSTNSTTSNSLIDFETAVEPLPAASTKNDRSFPIDAKFDFTRRSTAE